MYSWQKRENKYKIESKETQLELEVFGGFYFASNLVFYSMTFGYSRVVIQHNTSSRLTFLITTSFHKKTLRTHTGQWPRSASYRPLWQIYFILSHNETFTKQQLLTDGFYRWINSISFTDGLSVDKLKTKFWRWILPMIYISVSQTDDKCWCLMAINHNRRLIR